MWIDSYRSFEVLCAGTVATYCMPMQLQLDQQHTTFDPCACCVVMAVSMNTFFFFFAFHFSFQNLLPLRHAKFLSALAVSVWFFLHDAALPD